MPKYVLKKGYKHNQGTDEEIKPGDVIEMTEEQAAPFMDKFDEYHGGGVAKVPSTPIETKGDDEKIVLSQDDHDFQYFTIRELTSLPEWDLVPEPRPTKKADIIEALKKVREY